MEVRQGKTIFFYKFLFISPRFRVVIYRFFCFNPMISKKSKIEYNFSAHFSIFKIFRMVN